MSKIELMPCPFCGGENISEEMSMDNEPYSICTDCGASVDNGPDAWNTRADTSSDAAAMACRWLEAKESLATKDAEISRLVRENGEFVASLTELYDLILDRNMLWRESERAKITNAAVLIALETPIPDPAGGMPVEVK